MTVGELRKELLKWHDDTPVKSYSDGMNAELIDVVEFRHEFGSNGSDDFVIVY